MTPYIRTASVQHRRFPVIMNNSPFNIFQSRTDLDVVASPSKSKMLSLELQPPSSANICDALPPEVINHLKRLKEGVYSHIKVKYSGVQGFKGPLVMRWRVNAINRKRTTPFFSRAVDTRFEQDFACDLFSEDETKLAAPLIVFDVDESNITEIFPDLKISKDKLQKNYYKTYGDTFSKLSLSSEKSCHYVPILNYWVRMYANARSRAVVFGISAAEVLNPVDQPTIDVGAACELMPSALPRGLPVFDRSASVVVACVGHRIPLTGRYILVCSVNRRDKYSLRLAGPSVKFFKRDLSIEDVHQATLVKDDILYNKTRKDIVKMANEAQPLRINERENFKSVNVNCVQCGPAIVVVNITYPTEFSGNRESDTNASRQEMVKTVFEDPNTDFTLLWKDYDTRYANTYQFCAITNN